MRRACVYESRNTKSTHCDSRRDETRRRPLRVAYLHLAVPGPDACHCSRVRAQSSRPATMFASTAYSAIAFVALAIVWNSHTVESSIKCFVCNSHTDPKCAQEKVPDSFKKDCALLNNGVQVNEQKNYTLCRKTIQTIEPEVNGLPSDHNRIIRTCGWDNTEYNDRCYHRSGFGGKQDVCACSTDYCNSAQKTYIAFATVIAASFVILIL